MVQHRAPVVGQHAFGKCVAVQGSKLRCYLARTAVTYLGDRIECDPPPQFRELLEHHVKCGRVLRGAMAEAANNQVEFCGLSFGISREVFIPRVGGPERAVMTAVKMLESTCEPQVLDLGTGCGCLLLSILKKCVGSSGIGLDLSEPAVALARENGQRLELEKVCRFEVGDFGKLDESPVAGFLEEAGPFDLVVLAPPEAAESIQARGWQLQMLEPSAAVVAGPTGHEGYDAAFAALDRIGTMIKPGAKLLVRANARSHRYVCGLFSKSHTLERVIYDLSLIHI
eukprot:TRINITY_DN5539_c0_g1_i1.p1 TRINITY_DN5539_c0_g1~~TRINITY_DN5539_c0_g1_i1.p1  ORF type:complete len:284 (-),score=57.99 TRINITY_DN5539_c0_g1_i1:81-932(-)